MLRFKLQNSPAWGVALALVTIFGRPSRACSDGEFPEDAMMSGDHGVLAMPDGTFAEEMQRLLPASEPHFKALACEEGIHPDVFDQSALVDLADLKAALKSSGNTDADQIVNSYKAIRNQILKYSHARYDHAGNASTIGPLEIPDGLPNEFADYLSGSIAFHQGNLNEARSAWEALLNRPPNERFYRSTWAAFMLGRSWINEDPNEARRWFARTRQLADERFCDSLGLASSSIGWEARTYVNEHNNVKAMRLYFQQLATGDSTAAMSMRECARATFAAGANELATAADDDLCRRVLAAYILCDAGPYRTLTEKEQQLAPQFLAALESTSVNDLDGADRLAWTAYRAGQFESAARWVGKAPPDRPIARWVYAKLLLRNGNVTEAAEVLSKLVKSFPPNAEWIQEHWDTEPVFPIRMSGDGLKTIMPRAAGDLAVLQLVRGQYVDSLQLLERLEFFGDASYIAERVLTVDELKTYVDQHDKTHMGQILARRFVRAGRTSEARPYFSDALQRRLDDYVDNLRIGNNPANSWVDRASALLNAARLVNTYGRDLMDDLYAVTDYPTIPPGDRKTVTAPSDDELERFRISTPADPRHFRYPFIAADLAWQAARLMPDGADQTAAVLYEGGCWVKVLDPQYANRFYKAIVERCPWTRTGKAAANSHWFPKTIPDS